MPIDTATGGPLTLQADGRQVPSVRFSGPAAVQDWVRRTIDRDSARSFKRARVNGLVDGNPPYNAAKLKQAGRAGDCNVNWGIAASYLESGVGAFYDLDSEAPGVFTVRTAFGTEEQREVWSADISECCNRVIQTHFNKWDYNLQKSLAQMVLHGTGPLFFEDAYSVFPKAFLAGDLKVPEMTEADTEEWEVCLIQSVYYPVQLYRFIENPDAAAQVGWNVEFTRKVIARAMGYEQNRGIQWDWEFWQQELKNNSLLYMDDDNKVCTLAHVLWQEFDGSITHAIVERDTYTGADVQYLFLRRGRYQNWQQVIHPMYFDRGTGGYHHSVNGLGQKMYAAMEYTNRLICNLCDKAFAPTILFSPTSAEQSQKFGLVYGGDYAVMPRGFEMKQSAVVGAMENGLEMHQLISEVMQTNLSNFRTPGGGPQKSGNPVTKFEKQMQAFIQSALSKTQFNRHYNQADSLIREIYRRLTNLNTPDPIAKEFQGWLKEKGVPKEAWQRTAFVGQTRVVGQGSAFMRKQAIDSLFPVAGALPEEGRNHLLDDKIAAEAGQSAISRYNPKKKTPQPTDQQAEALLWVAAMKTGVAPVVTSSQNPLTYAATFLKAGIDALNSVRQGGNPMEVLQFLEMVGPAVVSQLSRFAQDPTRRSAYEKLLEQWKALAKNTDQLKKLVQQQQEKAKQQQAKTQAAMTDAQIKTAKAQNDIALKNLKTRAQLQQSAERHRLKLTQDTQAMALKDATTAADIHRNNLRTLNTDTD